MYTVSNCLKKRSPRIAQLGPLQGCNQGVIQGCILTWRLKGRKVCFQAQSRYSKIYFFMVIGFRLACLFKASNRQRGTQGRHVLHSYVTMYMLSHFPLSIGLKLIIVSVHTQGRGLHKGMKTRIWDRGGHLKICPPKCNIISTVKIL